MKIIQVDNNDELGALLRYALLRQGHSVVSVSDVDQVVLRSNREHYDIILVDIPSDKNDEFDRYRVVRQATGIPIVLMSSHGDESTIVHWYEAGVDDLVIKPFSPRQLILRINAVARRYNSYAREHRDSSSDVIQIEDLLIDNRSYNVRKNGRDLQLTKIEFRILVVLAGSAGKLVRHQHITEFAWEKRAVDHCGLLKTHISRIRQKLVQAGGSIVRIRAVSKLGYVLSIEKHQTLPTGGPVRQERLYEPGFVGAAHG
jgi:two-component system response regulator ResD